jgi:4-hydroxymandelate oxidase
MISDVQDGDETRRDAKDAASDLVCLGDYEECARARMTPAAAGFLASGVGDEVTVRANREAFMRMRLRPRALVDVSRIDTHVRLLGRDHPLPVVLAPTAYTGVFHPEGERAVARGAHDAGVTYTVASFSTTAIEDLRAESAGPLWFQLYMLSDRGLMREIMARAEAAGCEAFCLTVDHPVPGARNQERRARFELSNGLRRVHLDKLGEAAGRLGRPVSGGRNLYNPLMDASVTWKDAEALIASTRLPVLLKGILDADDAELAISSGAAAIVVSNHGGRTVDQLPAALDALPAIVQRVGGRVPLLVDGGVRRGTDIVIARALGADAVLIGRPYVHGLVVAGAAGVAQVVNILRQELEMAMALLGRTSLDRIDQSVLWSR